MLWQKGSILGIKFEASHKQIVEIQSNNNVRLGVNYPLLTGVCKIGDVILFNTTAIELNLGTGGFDFVIANLTNPPIDRELTTEHIMKNRYTPLQFAIQCGEEIYGLDGASYDLGRTLHNTPVLIICLHSMLPILALVIKEQLPKSKIIYVMTDSTSLPIWLSDHVFELKKKLLIESTITTGQSFGGDIEAVNTFSGMLLAKHECEADFIIIGPGPGSVGTGTEWGFSAIEVGELVNAVSILSGIPIVVPRISFSDKRNRHNGLSHHLRTSISKVALTSAFLPLPILSDHRYRLIYSQILESELDKKQQIRWLNPLSVESIKKQIYKYDSPILTMGRGIDDDPSFFQGVSTAARFALTI